MLLLLACSPFSEPPVAVVSPWVATVLDVDFDTWTSQETTVEYGYTAAYGFETPPNTGTHHHHRLIGMASGSDVHWRVVVDGEPGEDHVDTTGLLPSTMPTISTTVDNPTWDGFLVTTLLGQWQGPVIFDDEGRVVWYVAQSATETSPVRARIKRDGTGVIYNEVVSADRTIGALNFHNWDGQPVDAWSALGESHDFVELEDGRIATIEVEKHKVGDELVLGDRIALVDADGEEPLWSAFDWFDPATTSVDRPEGSWTHSNALDYDADADVFHLGIRNFDSIASIDGTTGELLDVLGGEANTGWTFPGVDRVFGYQHQFEFFDDHVLIFDNGDDSYDDTRVVEYALDPDAKTATEVWDHHFSPQQWLYALGDVDRLEDGSTLIAWDVGGRLEQVGADGTTLWQVETEVGYAFGYITRVDTLR